MQTLFMLDGQDVYPLTKGHGNKKQLNRPVSIQLSIRPLLGDAPELVKSRYV